MNVLTATAATVFAMALLGLSMSARADDSDDQPRKTLSVSGQGKISAAPDVADISVGVVTEARSARDALSANNRAMDQLQRELKQRGVAAKDIQTTNVNLSPRYSEPVPPQPGQRRRESFVREIVGYSVTNSVRITVRDLSKLGELLDAVVTAGANQMNGISFRVEETDKLMDEARKRAMADAKHKAELLCGESGMVLGPPIQISEGGGYIPSPQPMMARTMAMAAEAVPVSPGEEELSVSVQVVYEISTPE